MGTAIGDIVVKEDIELESLSGRVLGFDSLNILYQFLSNIRGIDGTPLMDSRGNITSHLTGLFYRTTNLIQLGLKPVFVFDGIAPELKEETRLERQKIRKEALEKFERAKREGDLETAKKFAQQSASINEKMIEDSKKLIKAMGLPLIQAPSEGEAQIAFMVEKGDLFACVSQDYDSLLFGAKTLLRNITITGKRKLPKKNIFIEVKPQKIELEKTLSVLGISRQKLVWIGILIGTDFNKKFPKIGVKTALELVKKFDSFEDILKETGFKPDFDWKKVEEIFLKPKVLKEYKIEFNEINREKVLELLVEEHDFSRERVENTLKKLEEKIEEKGEQSNLSKWF
jgi:flap endonuclease-1